MQSMQQTVITLLILAVWLWIGIYGFRSSIKNKQQKLLTAAWALLTVVIAVYIVSTLFI
jgi:hypothetical protein